jgi:hypothetical protein
VVAVAFTSAWVGFQMAQGQTMAELGNSIGIDMLAHRDGHKEPPPCGSYGNPPKNPKVPEKNKNCDPDN